MPGVFSNQTSGFDFAQPDYFRSSIHPLLLLCAKISTQSRPVVIPKAVWDFETINFQFTTNYTQH